MGVNKIANAIAHMTAPKNGNRIQTKPAVTAASRQRKDALWIAGVFMGMDAQLGASANSEAMETLPSPSLPLPPFVGGSSESINRVSRCPHTRQNHRQCCATQQLDEAGMLRIELADLIDYV